VGRLTKAELEDENETLRSSLEEARGVLSEALGYVEDDEESDSEPTDDDGDE
jgi:hypothetical protein